MSHPAEEALRTELREDPLNIHPVPHPEAEQSLNELLDPPVTAKPHMEESTVEQLVKLFTELFTQAP